MSKYKENNKIIKKSKQKTEDKRISFNGNLHMIKKFKNLEIIKTWLTNFFLVFL